MEQYIIRGGNPLAGEVEISGAKNAALGILAAAIMTDETVLIENLPDVRDINVLLEAAISAADRLIFTSRASRRLAQRWRSAMDLFLQMQSICMETISF